MKFVKSPFEPRTLKEAQRTIRILSTLILVNFAVTVIKYVIWLYSK